MARKRSRPARLLLDTSAVVHQSEQAEEAAKATLRVPSCRWCERLGDTIIALQTNRGVTIVTSDRTFVPLDELLGRTVLLLPSLAELKRRVEVHADEGDQPA